MIKAPPKPRPVTIIGAYAPCATEWPGAMMVPGYCHFSDGRFLKFLQVISAERRDAR